MARRPKRLSVKSFVSLDGMRGLEQDEAGVLAAIARWKLHAGEAGYVVLFDMCRVVRNLINSRFLDQIAWLILLCHREPPILGAGKLATDNRSIFNICVKS